jgi:UDP-N-acetylglucosamine/UDP-N-acetyl-alpha-D-glucosaminouronate 4-epimerase
MNTIVGTSLQPIYKDERVGDVKDSQADISKAKELLDYVPIVPFEEGLRHTLGWCRAESTATAGR